MHAVLVLEDAAEPHVPRHLVRAEADALPAEVLRPGAAGRHVHVDAEWRKVRDRGDRDRDELRVVARARDGMGAERQLGDVELAMDARTEENLLWFEGQKGEVHPVRATASVAERPDAVVVADREAEARLPHFAVA